MRAHAVTPVEPQVRRLARGRGLLQLGWAHYWLLVSILGGMLALTALIFLIAYFPLGHR